MRRRPERRGGLAGPAARGRGPARGCASRRSPGRWLGRRGQGCGAGCGLREEMGASGRLWAPSSRYLISLPIPLAVQRWVLRLPSLFVSSFCSFVSSPTGLQRVLCAVRISRLRPEIQRSAGSVAPVLNGVSQSGDLQNAHPPHTSTPTTHAMHLLHANKSIER